MPIYAYKCSKCKIIVEIQQNLDKKNQPMCCEENCNIEMDPIISKSNFALKGSCWAKDGYSKGTK